MNCNDNDSTECLNAIWLEGWCNNESLNLVKGVKSTSGVDHRNQVQEEEEELSEQTWEFLTFK